VRKNVVLLSKILNVAIKTRRLQVNECAGVELPPMAKRIMTVATPEQFDRLYSAIPLSYRMLVELAIETGARWGELAELRVRDFDADRCRILIARAVAENSVKVTGESTRYVVKDYPKSREHRAMRLRAPVSARPASYISTKALGSKDLLFSAKDGGHISRNNFRTRVWVPARKSVNLEGISFHGLRHAHASWLLASGADLQEVKERLGHASIATTERYLHTVDADDGHVIDAFTAFRNRAQAS
jgi:integrase